MSVKEFIQLFIPPVLHKVKKCLFPKPEPKRHPMPKIDLTEDRVIIIGNGPSLNKTMELYGDIIYNNECVMVNFSANTDLYERIRPSIYMLVDPAYFIIPDDLKESVYSLFDALVMKTKWPMNVIMPRCAADSYAIERFKENLNLKVLLYEDGWNVPKGMTQFEAWDKNVVIPPAQTVLNTAVWSAIYLGYKEIYLVGADSSWLEDTHVDQKDNRVYSVDSHFYNNQQIYENDTYWQEDRTYIPSTYHEEIETIYIILKSYWELREYADWKGVKVYNASEYSCIDAFERKKLK